MAFSCGSQSLQGGKKDTSELAAFVLKRKQSWCQQNCLQTCGFNFYMLFYTLYVVCKVQDYWDGTDCWATVIKKLVVRFVWETELSVTRRSKLIQLLLLVLNKQKPPTYYELWKCRWVREKCLYVRQMRK